MPKQEVKSLHVLKSDARTIDRVLDTAFPVSAVGIIYDSSVNRMLELLEDATQLRRDAMSPLFQPFRRLPADPSSKALLKQHLNAWLPAIRAGYEFRAPSDAAYTKIPQTSVIEYVDFDMEQGRWVMELRVLVGPLLGHSLSFLVSHRMSRAMLINAVGLRKAFSYRDRARAFDLYGMRLPIGFCNYLGKLSIANLMTSQSLRKANSVLMDKRTAVCELLNRGHICTDCGTSTATCAAARRDYVLQVGKCLGCGEQEPTSRKGLCASCLRKLAETSGRL